MATPAAEPASDDDLQLAEHLARRAGASALELFGTGLSWETKSGPSDPVSEADRRAERAAVDLIRRHRPGDGYLGEEGSTSAGAAAPRRRWVVDAVDGTWNFLHGNPYWCSAVCLSDGDDPLASAIYAPVVDSLVLAGRGRGARCNGRALPGLADQPLSALSVATYLHSYTLDRPELAGPLTAVLRACATVRVQGSGSLELADLVRGRQGVWLQHGAHDWDWLPGALVVTEAGGVAEVVDVGGVRWHLAGPSSAVREMRALLAGAQ